MTNKEEIIIPLLKIDDIINDKNKDKCYIWFTPLCIENVNNKGTPLPLPLLINHPLAVYSKEKKYNTIFIENRNGKNYINFNKFLKRKGDINGVIYNNKQYIYIYLGKFKESSTSNKYIFDNDSIEVTYEKPYNLFFLEVNFDDTNIKKPIKLISNQSIFSFTKSRPPAKKEDIKDEDIKDIESNLNDIYANQVEIIEEKRDYVNELLDDDKEVNIPEKQEKQDNETEVMYRDILKQNKCYAVAKDIREVKPDYISNYIPIFYAKIEDLEYMGKYIERKKRGIMRMENEEVTYTFNKNGENHSFEGLNKMFAEVECNKNGNIKIIEFKEEINKRNEDNKKIAEQNIAIRKRNDDAFRKNGLFVYEIDENGKHVYNTKTNTFQYIKNESKNQPVTSPNNTEPKQSSQLNPSSQPTEPKQSSQLNPSSQPTEPKQSSQLNTSLQPTESKQSILGMVANLLRKKQGGKTRRIKKSKKSKKSRRNPKK